MKYTFINYPKCSTCQKAKKWLNDNNINYEDRHIITECPTFEELKEWIEKSNQPIKKFFNTSGLVYKELNLKEKLSHLDDEEKIKLLVSNGMLIKRPIIIGKDIVLIGFKPDEWEILKNK